ncbi:hypothetical protein AJ78_08253 [Emergomyces pasteurianus Ep9510]|uniref:Retrovirus-related Pol polyprotein from transposon TNT 1-94-like beta-barrel domain-containing protein n=1 Tax=Emergomyces pasteurianus Ep9510 TaxID=1447872 RepID=A0A1J9P253_9EURO|nr:hypothetical protein AJ78_08253 [Emergomyces pasteurianus Ep9510]
MEAGIHGAFDLKIDFLNANLTIDAGYAQAWVKDVHWNENVIDLTSLINDFRERYKEMGILKTHLNATFATLNRRSTDRSTSRGRIQKIDEAFKDKNLKQKIDAALTKAASENTQLIQERPLGGMLLKSQENVRETEPDLRAIQSAVQQITMSVANQREYLRDSWIYDTDAEQHVCNNRSRFLTFTPAYAEVYTGDSFTRVEGYESVLTYMINEAGKEFRVTLLNAAYIPNCHINLMT